MGECENVFRQLHAVVAGVERAGDTARCRVDWHPVPPPRIGLAEADVVLCSLIVLIFKHLYFILYLYIIVNVDVGSDGGHISRRELLQLLGLKRICARLPADGLCPFRPHSPHRNLPQYGGG